jgi:FHS family L-fucose permease-like MFS transporter
VDSPISRFREIFTLSYFESGLVQFAFFGAYFLLSIPAGYILTRIGYQKGIILGLVSMAIGCFIFYPAAAFRMFGIFMLGYFILAGGMTILQVAANPYVAALGSEETSSSRLILSQAFNSLGTAIAPSVGAIYFLSDKILSKEDINLLDSSSRDLYFISEASAVQGPFIFFGSCLLVISIAFYFIKLPSLMPEKEGGTYKEAINEKNLMYGVFGIFFYVGAEVAIGSYLVNYFLDMNLVEIIKNNTTMNLVATFFKNDIFTKLESGDYKYSSKAVFGLFVTFYWTGAMFGRFAGSYLTKVYNAGKVLSIFAVSAILLIILSAISNGLLSMWSILAVGLFNSIMFPTIFTLSLNGLGDLKPKGSGLLCTGIVGGAIIPPLYGLLTDYMGFKYALLVLTLCYLYIANFGRINSKN